MDFGLTPEQEMVVSTVREFVETELHPLEPEVERLGHVPDEMARTIRDKVLALGFYAANFPAELGGGGLDARHLHAARARARPHRLGAGGAFRAARRTS